MSLLTEREEKEILIAQVCSEHGPRIMEFKIAILVFEEYFCEEHQKMFLSLSLECLLTRAKKDIVDAMMPVLDVDFDPNFYCASDRKWEKNYDHLLDNYASISHKPCPSSQRMRMVAKARRLASESFLKKE